MVTLLEHMVGNPLLVVQRRLGHAHPSTTYRYVKYLRDPMRYVDGGALPAAPPMPISAAV